MAQVEPEFEAATEFMDLAAKIIEKHSQKFTGINLELIKAVQITNKERGEKNNKLFEILPVKQPIRDDCKYAFYIIIYQADWDNMDRKHQLMLIAQSFHAIATDENGEMEEGKVLGPDMKDFACMIRSFGPDYLVKDSIPDLLDDEIKWVE